MTTQEETEDKPTEESRPYGHKNLSKLHKAKPRRKKKGVGTASLQTITKGNVQVTIALTIICSDM